MYFWCVTLLAPGQMVGIEKWNTNNDLAFMVGGVMSRNGRLVVPVDGYYFIYSQINFDEDVNGASNKELRHSIWR